MNIKDVCQEVYNKMLPKIPEGVVFTFNAGTHPALEVVSDKSRIAKVLSHFVDNAIKNTNSGEISISYRKEDENLLKVIVTDTGKGLKPDEIKRLYELFYKTDTFKQGVGIGLPLSKKIITDLGGNIGVESIPEVGSKFWFTLPLNNPQ